jgi:hypothetical protein
MDTEEAFDPELKTEGPFSGQEPESGLKGFKV